MTGSPGIGKTSFMKKLSYDWACEEFRQFALIFSVTLRLLNEQESIENAIISQSPPLLDKNVTPALMKSIMENYGHEILLLLDGYDELREDVKKSRQNPVDKIVRREKYGNVNVLITSRPQMTGIISQNFSSEASILGFSRDRAKKFVANFFPDQPELQDLIIEFAERNGERDMWRIPILLLFTCLLVQSGEIDVEKNMHVPLDTMYDRLIKCLFNRYCSKQGKHMTEEDIQKAILSFGKIALSCLKDDSLLFNKSEITEELGEHAFHYGFIIGEPHRRKISELSPADTRVMFVHRSLQEYLAALFVAHQVCKARLTLESIVPEVVMANLIEKYMLFTSFLDEMLPKSTTAPKQGSEISVNLPETESETESQFASQERNILCQKATESFAYKQYVKLVGYSITPASADFVTQALSNNRLLVMLEFEDLDLSHCLSQLFNGYMHSLKSMYFSSCVFKEDETVVRSFPRQSAHGMPSLKEVSICSCTLDSGPELLPAVVMLRKIFSGSKKLKTINLQSCDLRHKLCCLLDDTFCALEEIGIHTCQLDESPDTVETARPLVSKLQTVLIRDSQLGCGFYPSLAKFLASSKADVSIFFERCFRKTVDALLFCQAYPTVTEMQICEGQNSTDWQSSNVNEKAKLTNAGSFSCLKKLRFERIVLSSVAMKCLSRSLQKNMRPFELAFLVCPINGLMHLGMHSLPGLETISFSETSSGPETEDKHFTTHMNTFPNVKCLKFVSHDPNVSPEIFSCLTRCIAKSTRLTFLNIPVTWKALQILLECDLPVVETMFLTLHKDVQKYTPPVSFITGKRFPNLDYLQIAGKNEDDRLSIPEQFFTAISGHTKVRLCSFFCIDLSGCLEMLLANCFAALECILFANCVLNESHVANMDMFVGNLPKVVQFSHFKHSIWNNHALMLFISCLAGSKNLKTLKFCRYPLENVTDAFERIPYDSGHVILDPRLEQLRKLQALNSHEKQRFNMYHQWNPIAYHRGAWNAIADNVFENYACSHPDTQQHLVNADSHLDTWVSSYLKSFSFDPESHYLNVSNVLRELFRQGLDSLTSLSFSHCILNEDSVNLAEVNSPALPMLTRLELDATNNISNSAVKCVCKAIAGSKHLVEFSVRNADMTDCLVHMLTQDLPSLQKCDIESCILSEKENQCSKIKDGSLSSLEICDLTKCEEVNKFAIQILCKAIGSSAFCMGPTSLKELQTNEAAKKKLEIYRFWKWSKSQSDFYYYTLSQSHAEGQVLHNLSSPDTPRSRLLCLKLFNTDLDNCLSLLLSGPLCNLRQFDVVGCRLTDEPYSQNVVGYLPNVAEIDLTSCKTVSAHSVSILLSAVSGSYGLTSFSVKDVDLCVTGPDLLVQKFPSLAKLLMEGCTLSAAQLGKFVEAKSQGYYPALTFLLFNGTQGIADFCNADLSSDPESPRHAKALDKLNIVSLCVDMSSIGLKGSHLNQNALDSLASAIAAGKIDSLKQVEIDCEILSDFSKEIFQQNGVAIF